MDTLRDFLSDNWPQLAIPLAVLLATVLLGIVAKKVALAALKRWVDKEDGAAGRLFLFALARAMVLWIWLLGIYLAVQSSVIPARYRFLIGQGCLVAWVISLILVSAHLAGTIVQHYGKQMSGTLGMATLAQNLARLAVIAIGVLILLSMLGVSIAPLLTALGVGGLALALGLQDTLANLFAGLYVSLANQVRLGDYIKLDTSEEGYVTDIAWRATTLRNSANNLVIIPNAKLAKAVITNFDLPEKRTTLSIPISVGYDADVDKVEHLLLEVATSAAGDIPGLLADPAPSVLLIPGFGSCSLDFTLTCQLAGYAHQGPVQHELRKRIIQRFRHEGIDFPYPVRTVYLHPAKPADSV